MAFDYRREHLSYLRQSLSTFVSPLQFLVNLPVLAMDWSNSHLRTHSELVSENNLLHDENLILKAKSQKLIELEAQNARLKALLGSLENRREQRQIADIISVRASEFHHEVIINKGSLNNVFVGQTVIDAEGIMGQVSELTPFSARVILITDERHAIPVRDLRNGVRAIASGTGSLTKLELNQIPHSIDIKTNDILVSSGLGQRFPAGLNVAKVSLVRHQQGDKYAYIEASPLARLERSGQVILLWPDDPLAHDSKKNKEVNRVKK